jgi:hypothetical protein
MINSNKHIPRQALSIPETVTGLMNFMNDQIKFNINVRHDLGLVNKELYEPAMIRKQNLICMSAIL